MKQKTKGFSFCCRTSTMSRKRWTFRKQCCKPFQSRSGWRTGAMKSPFPAASASAFPRATVRTAKRCPTAPTRRCTWPIGRQKPLRRVWAEPGRRPLRTGGNGQQAENRRREGRVCRPFPAGHRSCDRPAERRGSPRPLEAGRCGGACRRISSLGRKKAA